MPNVIAHDSELSVGPDPRNPDGLPDRLSLEPASPFYDAAALARRPGVRLSGIEQSRVVEYCISEGWVRRHTQPDPGTVRVNRKGRMLAFRAQGQVEVWARA